jgi:hypothetical protein
MNWQKYKNSRSELALGHGGLLVAGLLALVDLVPEGERHTLRLRTDSVRIILCFVKEENYRRV